MACILPALATRRYLFGVYRQNRYFGGKFCIRLPSIVTARHRHPGTPNAFTIQICFSPTENLLAWTDTEGILSRWRDAVPASSPDPVRQTVASNAQGTTTKRKSTPPLWGEEANIDAERDDAYGGDDWIIDDLGNGMEEESEGAKAARTGDGFVKEMGEPNHGRSTWQNVNGNSVSITKAQPAFQPGSTPMENKRRYLGKRLF